MPKRFVIDTNVFVSAAILPASIPRQVIDQALESGIILVSESTIAELTAVLCRKKLDYYISKDERVRFLDQLTKTAEFVPIIRLVRECRDPGDNKILELALNGQADVIITGDEDLLCLHPWRGIEILSPGEYLHSTAT